MRKNMKKLMTVLIAAVFDRMRDATDRNELADRTARQTAAKGLEAIR